MPGDTENYGWLAALNTVAMQRYRARDIRGLTNVLARYQSLQPPAPRDPPLSTLETATVQCILMLAEAHLDELQFERCLLLCHGAVDILDEKARRFLTRGQSPPPDSVARCRLVGILGDAKWKGPDSIRDAVLSLHEMAVSYLRAERSIRAGLARRERSAEETTCLTFNLACCGRQVIRTLMRHEPDRVQAVRASFAGYHGEILSQPSHPFYWDLRICALFLAHETRERHYKQCYARRRATFLEQASGEFDLRAYDRSASNELAHLLAACKRSVVQFPARR